MRIILPPGKYVVAVSGGVDSVSLLHALSRQPGLELVVAHFDHGIREDSADDERLVRALAQNYGLICMSSQGYLGAQTSEATAREHRYRFLRQVRRQTGARAIITAHHQDDVLETAILNLLRGTGRLGLSSLKETDELRRPLLAVTKAEIISYARQHRLQWREDSTNGDERYRRNYVRQRIMPVLTAENRLKLLNLIGQTRKINSDINSLVSKLLAMNGSSEQLNRGQFTLLSHDVSKELLAQWLRTNGVADFDRQCLERLTVGAKTLQPGKRLDVARGLSLRVRRDVLALEGHER